MEIEPLDLRYTEHPVFTPPEDLQAVVWRYIDFTKLVSMLDTQSLFFACAERLSDPFEGSLSRVNPLVRPLMYPELYKQPVATENLDAMWSFLAEMRLKARRETFINCWSMNQRESAALWGLYVPPTGGVAIRSTFERLRSAFGPIESLPESDPTPRVYIGRVQYMDYDADWIPEGNALAPFVHKRHSFEFEGELRAVYCSRQAADGERDERCVDPDEQVPQGVRVSVDLDRLIERVHVSPAAPAWLAELVKKVCLRYGLAAPVVQSDLAGTPVY